MTSVNKVSATHVKAAENYYNFNFETSMPKSDCESKVNSKTDDFAEGFSKHKYRQDLDEIENLACNENI